MRSGVHKWSEWGPERVWCCVREVPLLGWLVTDNRGSDHCHKHSWQSDWPVVKTQVTASAATYHTTLISVCCPVGRVSSLDEPAYGRPVLAILPAGLQQDQPEPTAPTEGKASTAQPVCGWRQRLLMVLGPQPSLSLSLSLSLLFSLSLSFSAPVALGLHTS